MRRCRCHLEVECAQPFGQHPKQPFRVLLQAEGTHPVISLSAPQCFPPTVWFPHLLKPYVQGLVQSPTQQGATRGAGPWKRRPSWACAPCVVDPRTRRSAYCGGWATACASRRWAAARAASSTARRTEYGPSCRECSPIWNTLPPVIARPREVAASVRASAALACARWRLLGHRRTPSSKDALHDHVAWIVHHVVPCTLQGERCWLTLDTAFVYRWCLPPGPGRGASVLQNNVSPVPSPPPQGRSPQARA